jgi:hypothetical protein
LADIRYDFYSVIRSNQTKILNKSKKTVMPNQIPKPQNTRLAWVVVATLFLVLAFWFTFVQGNVAQGIIWFGAAFPFFIIANNPKA